MKETCILLRNQTEFPKMSNNSKNTGVEFAEHGSLDSILRPCSYNILWNGPSPERALQMDAGKSAISFLNIRPVGQFSRFSIQKKLRMVN